MTARNWHRYVGIFILPMLLLWALTGVFFLYKPGYSKAYGTLEIVTYPVDESLAYSSEPGWHQYRILQTALGKQLLVNDGNGWEQRDVKAAWLPTKPSEAQIKTIVEDAIKFDPNRYGEIVFISGAKVMTSTGVEITLDWHQMKLTQRGSDTRLISWLYDLHSLRWLDNDCLNRVLGSIGGVLLVVLSILGLVSWLTSRAK